MLNVSDLLCFSAVNSTYLRDCSTFPIIHFSLSGKILTALYVNLWLNIFRNNIDEHLTVVRKTARANGTYKLVCFLALVLTPAAFNTKHIYIENEMNWMFSKLKSCLHLQVTSSKYPGRISGKTLGFFVSWAIVHFQVRTVKSIHASSCQNIPYR